MLRFLHTFDYFKTCLILILNMKTKVSNIIDFSNPDTWQ